MILPASGLPVMGASGDPFYDNVVLLLQATDSGMVVDQSKYNHTLTQTNISVTTTNPLPSKANGRTITATTAGRIRAAKQGGEFSFSGLFTVEFWVRQSSDDDTLFEMLTSSNAVGVILYTANDAPLDRNYVFYGGSNRLNGGAEVVQDWRHICYQMTETAGNNQHLFIDGVLKGSANAASLASFTGGDLVIGNQSSSSVYNLVGNIDLIRVTNGVARYPSTGFTPPTDLLPTF